jgi:fatty-acyl-CoA synthase
MGLSLPPARTMPDASPDLVYDWLRYHAQYSPRDLAAVDLATGRRFDYARFDERATRLATGLAARHGIARGHRVAILAHNSTDFFELMFACWKLGAIFMPLNWRLTAFEIGQVVGHGEPKLVFADEEFLPSLDHCAVPIAVRRSGNPADCDYEALIETHAPLARMPRLTLDDVNTLLYTSGTTGRPKGVIGTFRMTMNVVIHAAAHGGLDRSARTLTYAPLFHAAGLNAAAMPLFHYGGALYVMKRWDTAQCLQLLTDPEVGITHAVGVPTNYILMSQLPEFADATFPTVRVAGVGSAPVSMDLLETWAAKGLPLAQSFGMTEVFSVAFTPPHRTREKIGSAGFPMLHVAVQIGDPDGNELPRGTVGEIQVRGPGVTPGYWRDPDLTAAAFTANGWFRTGDAARMEADGTLYIVDRIKDMIISGGENIYPSEIEHAITSLDAVSQAAVIGVPDQKWGEVGLALVMPKPGRQLTPEDVLARCAERLARYKLPHRVLIVDSLPLSPQGKILKRELRDSYRHGLEA